VVSTHNVFRLAVIASSGPEAGNRSQPVIYAAEGRSVKLGPREEHPVNQTGVLTGETENSTDPGLAFDRNHHGSSRGPSASFETENFGFRAEVVNYAWNLEETGAWPDAHRAAFCKPLGGKELAKMNLAPREEHRFEHGFGESGAASILQAVNGSGDFGGESLWGFSCQ